MIPYDEVTSLIHFNNHSDRVRLLYRDYFTSNISFSIDDVLEVLSYIDIPIALKNEIASYYSTIMNDNDALLALQFIRLITVERAHPSEWLLNREPWFSSSNIPSGVFSVYSLIVIAIYQIKIYKNNNIDASHIEFNLKHLKGYLTKYHSTYNKIGVDNYTWCIYLASLGLIHLHTLHFMHHIYSERFIILQKNSDQSVVCLALADIDVRLDGQIDKVNSIENYYFTTVFKETKTSYIGHRVNPYGAITKDVLILSKMEYNVVLKPGDFVIDFHIPTGKGYTVENTKESFIQAKTFFNQVYPEYDYKAFWCLSWLSSPQIPFFLKNPQSNIYQISEQSYTLPATNDQSSILQFVFGDGTIDVNTINPQTSLEKGIVEYNQKGGRINCGVFLFLMTDIEHFGNSIYRSKKDLLEFTKMNKIK